MVLPLKLLRERVAGDMESQALHQRHCQGVDLLSDGRRESAAEASSEYESVVVLSFFSLLAMWYLPVQTRGLQMGGEARRGLRHDRARAGY